ncbi:MAG: CHAP domain-containing protein [Candidatus Portnoybacteria bacterium]|nr:CHAP domain-containing protein [Candidatus Portnoybacteria bacterium]MDD4982984.1 CHAP domain-containing protein [Candidatus Portnoybacteria bacterium]
MNKTALQKLLEFILSLFRGTKKEAVPPQEIKTTEVVIQPEIKPIIENIKQQPKEEIKIEDTNDLPVFVVKVANLVNDPNTIKLRKIIRDEFTGGKNGWDLQCTEYVQYRVQRNGIVINWPADRPRHGGKWADIFEKNKMYKVLDEPRDGCAVSFTKGTGDATGHIAFVEQVLADQAIKISEANWPPPGTYNERTIKKVDWQNKYGCRFIDFS